MRKMCVICEATLTVILEMVGKSTLTACTCGQQHSILLSCESPLNSFFRLTKAQRDQRMFEDVMLNTPCYFHLAQYFL